MARLIEFLKTLPGGRLVALLVLAAIVTSQLLVAGQSLWLYGEVRLELVLIAFTTSVLAGLLLATLAMLVVDRLKQTERVYTSAQEIAHVGHWELDLATGRARWSDELCQIFGIADDRGVGPEFLRTRIHPHDQPLFEQALTALRERGEHYDIEYRIRRTDGEERWLNCRAECHLDVQGRPFRVTGVAQDITGRKQAEIASQESRQRLQLAGRLAYDLIYEWDPASDTLHWFGSIDRLLGYPSGTVGPSIAAFQALVHPGDRARLAEVIERHRTDTTPISAEFRVRHASGDYRYWVEHGLPLLDDHGRPQKWVGVCTDTTDRKRAELDLQEREHLLRTVLDEMPDVVVLKDAENNFVLANAAVAELYGTTPTSMIGKSDADFGVPAEMAELMRRSVMGVMAAGRSEIVHEQSRDATSGRIRHFKSIKKPFHDTHGRARVLVIAHDITDIVDAQAQVAESEERLRSILDNVDAYIYLKDLDGRYLFANKAARTLWDAGPEDVVGADDRAFFDAATAEEIRRDDQRVLINGETLHTEEVNTLTDGGHTTIYQTTKLPLRRDSGEIYALCGISVDITRHKRHQQELERVAHYDGLTDLPNRILLAERLQQAIIASERTATDLAVVYLDLDGFKEVNDLHGHETGDRLLRIVAERMRKAVRTGDTLARLGGDEFVAVLSDFPDGGERDRLLSRLLTAVAEPVHIGRLVLRVSASLGVSLYPQAEELDADQLLRQADQAMYLAKLAGKNRYHLFDTELDRHARGRQRDLERVLQAMRDGELCLYYQPKVNMRTGELIGAEALLRWHHPEQGMLLPGQFLPTVENHPAAVEIGEWVIDSALHQMAAWRDAGLDIPVSVNVGTLQLEQGDFVARLAELLGRYPGVPAGSLELEILETGALRDVVEISRIMLACHDIGVSFALDDFGTGYSSLTYLKRLPAATLKIDRSFVRDMLDDPDDLAILEGVIGLATAFRLATIAEGVESVEHGAMLLQLGCELAQGFVIARPMPADALPGWTADWSPPAAWSQLRSVDRDHLPILSAAVNHRAWVSGVEAYLTGHSPQPPALDDRKCHFGRWLHAVAEGSEIEDVAYARIGRLHTQVHELASELCTLVDRDRRAEALSRIPELHDRRDALTAQIGELLHRYSRISA